LDKDATASFLEDGRVVFACGEERLSRVKLQGGFPHRAVRLGLERTGWDPVSIDAVAYAFFDGEGEARLMQQALEKDAQAHHADCTSASLRHLQKVSSNGYAVNRSRRIPGLPTEQSEFMPRKPWLKRTVYHWAASSPWLDWQIHRRFFKRWVTISAAEHHQYTYE
jgi:carbamoyltransferase